MVVHLRRVKLSSEFRQLDFGLSVNNQEVRTERLVCSAETFDAFEAKL